MFVEPKALVVKFEAADIITTSSQTGPETDQYGNIITPDD